MAYYHGIRTRQEETPISTPVIAASGITFVVGTAPIHGFSQLSVNEPVYCGNNNEAVSTFGYNDDWEKYTLCEVMYNHYKLYNVAPVIFVNVLDPVKHKKAIASKEYAVIDKRVKLPFEAIKESVIVEGYKIGDDFELFYDGNNLVLEIIDNGAILPEAKKISVAFNEVDPSLVTKADIIGGFNPTTKETTGFELIESVFPKYGIVPDILICPGWSHDSEVAAIMGAKAESINGIFEAKAFCDVDTSAVNHYADVTEWKKSNNINSKTQVLCFPMGKLGDRIFHLSTQMAGLTATVDINNGGCPAESPSNKSLRIDSSVLADGTEVLLDLQQANYLNSNGIVTAINFIGGFVLWGNFTACYPVNTDVKDYFICVSRMFGWVSNSVIQTYWSKVDKKLNRRFIDSIVDSLNIWLNGLTSEGKILGGRVEFREEENNEATILSGKAIFRIFMTPPSPAQETEFILAYDAEYAISALAA